MRIGMAALAAGFMLLGGLNGASAQQRSQSLLPDGTLIAGPCDRACMMGLADDYLAANVAHDPKLVLWGTRPKYTENGVILRPGEGTMWNAVTRIGSYKNYFVDMKGKQVGYHGVVYQGDTPILVGFRMKVAGRRITEVEAITGGRGKGAEDMEKKGAPPPMFSEAIAAGQKANRQQLIDAADAYFNGIEQSSGDMIPFATTCNRIENGGQTTNLTSLDNAPYAGPGTDSWRSGFLKTCREQINSGMFAYIPEARDRRYEVVDEEKGNILAFAIFAHPGDVKKAQLPGQPVVIMPPSATRPFDTYLAEAFHVRGGQIQQVEAVIYSGPYGMDSGWERK
ncbi:MAG: hypothetical protein ABIO39_09975 [Caulobacteraceae bacterium]